MIYYILILLPGITSLFVRKPEYGRIKSARKTVISVYDLVFFLLCILMFITIAFRGSHIGSDTYRYLVKYQSIRSVGSYAQYGGLTGTEPLYYYLNKLLSFVFKDWAQCVLVVEAGFVSILYGKTIRRYSSDSLMSMISFMAFGLFLASLCLVRQFLAMSICCYSLKYVFERKTLRFYFAVIIATLFHYTAIFFAVAYLVAVVIKKDRKKLPLFIAIAVIGYLFADRIQRASSMMFDRWGHYENIETGAQGFISFTIYLIITVLVIHNQKIIEEKVSYGTELININYLHMILWTIRLVTRNAERIAFYFAIAPILLLPYLCEAIDERYGKKNGLFFRCAVIILMMALFIYKFPRDASIYPYEFMK